MQDENTIDSVSSETTDQPDPNLADSQATDSSSSTTDKTILTDDADEGDVDESSKTGEKTSAADDKTKVDDPDPPANELLGAPEGDYEIEGLAEGVVIDKVVLDALAPIAKEIGISGKGMSKLAGVYQDTILPHLQTAITKGIEDQVAVQGKAWDAETRAEVEGGKDAKGAAIAPSADYGGASFKDVRAAAARALDRFAGPELRQFLDDSKLGNHPALVKAFFRIGSAIKEDGFERADTTKGQPKSRAEKYYGDRATT